jgi:hypothetical protein
MMKAVSARELLIIFIPSISILLAMVAIASFTTVSSCNLTRDVFAIAHLAPLNGLLSNLGILLWCSTASISFFSAMILHRSRPRDTLWFWFLLVSALLSAYLLFDDFFMFHEDLAPGYLGLNSDKSIYAALGIVISAYLIKFRRAILQTSFGILLLSLGFFAISMFIDVISNSWRLQVVWPQVNWCFLEDGVTKFLGVACWCSYHVNTSYQHFMTTFSTSTAIRSDAEAEEGLQG